jgi:hypothetical protein
VLGLVGDFWSCLIGWDKKRYSLVDLLPSVSDVLCLGIACLFPKLAWYINYLLMVINGYAHLGGT